MRKRTMVWIGVALFLGTTPAHAHGMIPAEMEPLHPGLVIATIETDLLLPGQFKHHPGPLFYLSHAKELSLTPAQQAGMMKIAHRIMPKTIAEGRQIDRLRRRYLRLVREESPPLEKARALLRRLALLEARATSDHLEAHLACRSLLSATQKISLGKLMLRGSSPEKAPPGKQLPPENGAVPGMKEE